MAVLPIPILLTKAQLADGSVIRIGNYHPNPGRSHWSLRTLGTLGTLGTNWTRDPLRSLRTCGPSGSLITTRTLWTLQTSWTWNTLLSSSPCCPYPLRPSRPLRALWPRREAADVGSAKLTGRRIHQHRLDRGSRSHRTNSSQKYRSVKIRVPDPDRAGLPSHTVVADVNVVIACGEVNSGASAQSDVAVTGGICGQRLIAHSRVVSAGREAQQSIHYQLQCCRCRGRQRGWMSVLMV